MRLVLTGGGSGGHVYPALAVAAALLGQPPAPGGIAQVHPEEILYIGGQGDLEGELVTRVGLPYVAIRAGGLRGNPWRAGWSLGLLSVGFFQARRLLGRHRPQALLATGGYVSVPVVLAAWSQGIPVLLYLPDIEPGWAVRFLAPFARRIAVTSERSREFLAGHHVEVTGYPVRPQFWEVNKEKARERFGLEPQWRTLLILGGSQGARPLNRAVRAALPELLSLAQVVHLCGRLDERELVEVRDHLPTVYRRRYRLFPYLYDGVAEAFAAADLAISRAGASVLGELPAVGLPALLVPYPRAGKHQRRNAQPLVEAGAALLLEEHELDRLLPLVRRLLEDPIRLEEMSQKVRSLAQPQAAGRIAQLLRELAQERTAA